MPRGALGSPPRVHEHERGAMLAARARRGDRRPASTLRPTSPLRAAPAALRCARSRLRAWPLSTMVQSCARPRRRLRGADQESARLPRSASAWRRARRASAAAPASASSRSSDSARCAPRLLPASAWISSTITVRVVASMLRPDSEPSRMYSDSGVVTTMCGGLRRALARSDCGVSPVRTKVRIATSGSPSARSSCADARERRLEIAVDVVRQRLERRDVDDLRLVREPSLEPIAHQPVDGGQKRRERLARSGGRRDQHVPSRLDRGPCLQLRRRWARRRPARTTQPPRGERNRGGSCPKDSRNATLPSPRSDWPASANHPILSTN